MVGGYQLGATLSIKGLVTQLRRILHLPPCQLGMEGDAGSNLASEPEVEGEGAPSSLQPLREGHERGAPLTSMEQPSRDPLSSALWMILGRLRGGRLRSYISDTPPVKSSKPSVVLPPDRDS